jgi:hypothetical protein
MCVDACVAAGDHGAYVVCLGKEIDRVQLWPISPLARAVTPRPSPLAASEGTWHCGGGYLAAVETTWSSRQPIQDSPP